VIRPLDPNEDAEACDRIVRALPDWFELEEGIREAAIAVRTQDGLVVEEDEAVVGFLTWNLPRTASAEITWMAVLPDSRRKGHGRALIEDLVSRLRADGVRWLFVKTLSDREPSTHYAETRAFYEAIGFDAALDLDIWGPENPALLYVRDLR
jgi:N-acetylglutamate synthase-like GNAT family acetyltransferase